MIPYALLQPTQLLVRLVFEHGRTSRYDWQNSTLGKRAHHHETEGTHENEEAREETQCILTHPWVAKVIVVKTTGLKFAFTAW